MQKLVFCGKEIKKIGFLGLGKSSVGMLDYFKTHYPYLSFTLRSDTLLKKSDTLIPFFDRTFIGDTALSDVCEDILFLSPSARRDKISELARKTILSSDAEFFFHNVEYETYAITGSDGKSTTTHLTALLLADSYDAVHAIGNIGCAMTPFLESPKKSVAVCELSSFQLNDFAPASTRALITNITPNHLDWHNSFNEYISAKKNVLKNAEACVFNADCAISSEFSKEFNTFAVYSANYTKKELSKKYNAEHYVYIDDGFICNDDKELLPVNKIKIPGRHGIYNFLAAISLCADKKIEHALHKTAQDFCGLSHRCEIIGVFNGIKYVDSSIDTSPQRTITTLSSFTDKVTVILGGKSKGLDFKVLIPVLKNQAKAIVLTGDTGKIINELLARESYFYDNRIHIEYHADFDTAVLAATRLSSHGDTVILSPASTSFDAFSNFEERGEHFKSTVKKIHQSSSI